jgi:hypothetical protein
LTGINRRRLRPVAYDGLVRLGPPADGGYVVPAPQIKDAAVLLSLGMKDDWAFERDFVRANPRARIISVDRSVGTRFFLRRLVTSFVALLRGSLRGRGRDVRKHGLVLRNAIDYFVFFAVSARHIRKMASAEDTASTISIAGLLAEAGVERDHSVVLKVDVEGAEYGLVPDIARHAARFSCVVAEFHRLHKHPALFDQAVAALGEHFTIAHVHGNNYSRYDPLYGVPDAVEITFVNQALIPDLATPSEHEYPRSDLDRPNHPGRPDHVLRFD